MTPSVQASAIDDDFDFVPAFSYTPLSPPIVEHQQWVEPGDARSAIDDRCETEYGFVATAPRYRVITTPEYLATTKAVQHQRPTLEKDTPVKVMPTAKNDLEPPIMDDTRNKASLDSFDYRKMCQYEGVIVRAKDGREVRLPNPFVFYLPPDAADPPPAAHAAAKPASRPLGDASAAPRSTEYPKKKVIVRAKDGREVVLEPSWPYMFVNRKAPVFDGAENPRPNSVKASGAVPEEASVSPATIIKTQQASKHKTKKPSLEQKSHTSLEEQMSQKQPMENMKHGTTFRYKDWRNQHAKPKQSEEIQVTDPGDVSNVSGSVIYPSDSVSVRMPGTLPSASKVDTASKKQSSAHNTACTQCSSIDIGGMGDLFDKASATSPVSQKASSLGSSKFEAQASRHTSTTATSQHKSSASVRSKFTAGNSQEGQSLHTDNVPVSAASSRNKVSQTTTDKGSKGGSQQATPCRRSGEHTKHEADIKGVACPSEPSIQSTSRHKSVRSSNAHVRPAKVGAHIGEIPSPTPFQDNANTQEWTRVSNSSRRPPSAGSCWPHLSQQSESKPSDCTIATEHSVKSSQPWDQAECDKALKHAISSRLSCGHAYSSHSNRRSYESATYHKSSHSKERNGSGRAHQDDVLPETAASPIQSVHERGRRSNGPSLSSHHKQPDRAGDFTASQPSILQPYSSSSVVEKTSRTVFARPGDITPHPLSYVSSNLPEVTPPQVEPAWQHRYLPQNSSGDFSQSKASTGASAREAAAISGQISESGNRHSGSGSRGSRQPSKAHKTMNPRKIPMANEMSTWEVPIPNAAESKQSSRASGGISSARRPSHQASQASMGAPTDQQPRMRDLPPMHGQVPTWDVLLAMPGHGPRATHHSAGLLGTYLPPTVESLPATPLQEADYDFEFRLDGTRSKLSSSGNTSSRKRNQREHQQQHNLAHRIRGSEISKSRKSSASASAEQFPQYVDSTRSKSSDIREYDTQGQNLVVADDPLWQSRKLRPPKQARMSGIPDYRPLEWQGESEMQGEVLPYMTDDFIPGESSSRFL